MASFFLHKALRLTVLLAAVATLTFLLLASSPIDPVRAYIGADMLLVGAEQRAEIAERWGLDQPLPVRFVRWAGQLLQGNLGVSMIYNVPVTQVIGDRFLASLSLMAAAWAISGVLGFVLGVVAGAMPGSLLDQGIRFYAYTLASTPTFWLALLLLIVFSVSLRLTPICCATPVGVPLSQVTIWQRLHHLLLPAATLSILGVANIALHTRQKLVEVMESDFILFARAQGERRWGLIGRHGLRHVFLPAITLQFAGLSELFAGSILAEQVFSYPGLGQATVEAGLRGDVPLLLGIVLFSAIFVFTGNTLADFFYRVADPRLRARMDLAATPETGAHP